MTATLSEMTVDDDDDDDDVIVLKHNIAYPIPKYRNSTASP